MVDPERERQRQAQDAGRHGNRQQRRSRCEIRPHSEKLPPVALLEVVDVTRRFGGITALDAVSLAVEEGEIAGLIGPNGAGKTTAFNVITRLYTPNEGSVRFAGNDLLSVGPHRIVGLGIARTFQNLELCSHMTVLENVQVGAHSRSRFGHENEAERDARESLDYLGLGALARQPAAGCRSGR